MATAMSPTYVNVMTAIATDSTIPTGIFAIPFAITIWRVTDASTAHVLHQINVNAFMDLRRVEKPILLVWPVNSIQTATKWKVVQSGKL